MAWYLDPIMLILGLISCVFFLAATVGTLATLMSTWITNHSESASGCCLQIDGKAFFTNFFPLKECKYVANGANNQNSQTSIVSCTIELSADCRRGIAIDVASRSGGTQAAGRSYLHLSIFSALYFRLATLTMLKLSRCASSLL